MSTLISTRGCSSSSVELSLHLCISLVAFAAMTWRADSTHSEIYVMYVFTTLGGMGCCSMLRRGTRVSSWIGFNLFTQLSFLILSLIQGSDYLVHTAASTLFSILLALHVTSCTWKDEMYNDLAVAIFHIRLIRMSFVPLSSSVFTSSMCVLFLCLHHRIEWMKSTSALNSYGNVLLEGIYIFGLGVLEVFVWFSFIEHTDGGWITLVTLVFAVLVKKCNLDLSSSELLLLYGFVQVAVASMVNSTLSVEVNSDIEVSSSFSDSYTVIAVSCVGVLGILLLGAQAAVCMKFLSHLKWSMSSASPICAACFVMLLVGVICFFMGPGMHHVIVSQSSSDVEESSNAKSLPFILQALTPAKWIAKFLFEKEDGENPTGGIVFSSRLGVCLYWILSLVIFLPSFEYICRKFSRHIPQIASRKLFHFLCVAMFTPIIWLDGDMMFLSFSVAFCALLLIEYVRYFNIMGIQSSSLNKFYLTFMDERDSSRKIALTHIQLLLGCALPFMLSFGLSVATRHILPMDASLVSPAGLMLPYLGIITVGIGDAMAAIIGSKFGHFRWMKYSMENKRTVEGTLGGLVSMYLFSVLLWSSCRYGIGDNFSFEMLPLLAMTVCSAAVIETFTTEADNIIMPLGAAVVQLSLGILKTKR